MPIAHHLILCQLKSLEYLVHLVVTTPKMDHILVASDDHAHKAIEVPYLDDERFRYDDLGLLSYPERVAVDVVRLAEDRDTSLRLNNSAPFIQAWLWFGLLGECLLVGLRHSSAPKRIHWGTFVKTIANQRFVSLRELNNVLSEPSARAMSAAFIEWRSQRLLACTRVAHDFVARALDTLKLPNATRKDETILSDTILVCLSVQILCQTLLETMSPRSGVMPLELPPNVSLDAVNLLLKGAGWCPKDIDLLPKDVVYRFYLTSLRPRRIAGEPGHRGRHGCSCHQGQGQATSPDSMIEPLHTRQTCQCTQHEMRGQHLKYGLKNDSMFIFKLPQGTTLSFDRVPLPDMSIETPLSTARFVAISHVRSVGLGNDRKNSLPFCQLTLIQVLVNQIDPPQNEQTDTAFWIDTMALPTDLRRRKPMLSSLRRVFGTATAVLVLDPSLSTHCFRSAEEALIQIRYSLWKQRLWTIEEAFFARRLIFRFANRMVSLDELLTAFSASRPLRVPVLKPPLEILPVDHESMMSHLICFANDIHATPENTIDKRELYRILRAGYLSSPKFRYFVEPGELNLTKQACFAIQNTYQSTTSMNSSLDHVAARLGLVLDTFLGRKS
ncbi:HET domain protein [Metarhizium robertsii ARSEF 23]|uniref:HET domain protein n=2 Tax=Metarhizium robertsii TaxID=568076 RepID=E9FAE0_METRA|nr:HET domain protein [Metarhizium robertsii ARSEF 23]EFY95290.2 HET domain protein [Metarhizium robertsii ARSEF 23]